MSAARRRGRAPRHPRGGPGARDVRPHRGRLRPHERGDDRGPAPPLARARGRSRRGRTGRSCARRRDRHRRPRDRAGAARRSGGRSGRRRLLASACSSSRGPRLRRCASSRPTRSSCPTPTTASTRRRSASARAISPTSTAGWPRWPVSCGPAGASWCSRSRTPRRPPLSLFLRVWFDRLVPALGRLAGERGGLQLPARLGAALSRRPRSWPRRWRHAGLDRHRLVADRGRDHRDPPRRGEGVSAAPANVEAVVHAGRRAISQR